MYDICLVFDFHDHDFYQIATLGCSDYANLDVVYNPSSIVGCRANWTKPGLLNANQFCDNNNHWSACESKAEARDRGLTSDICQSISPRNKFFATHAYSKEKIWGCGKKNAQRSLPVTYSSRSNLPLMLNRNTLENQLNDPNNNQVWRLHANYSSFPDSSSKFFNTIIKVDDSQGGILCCYHEPPTQSELFQFLQTVVTLAIFMILIVCAAKCLQVICQRIAAINRHSCSRTCPCLRRFLDENGVLRIGTGNRAVLVPTSVESMKIMKTGRQIEKKLQTKAFKKYFDDGEISQGSANCIICFDDYEPTDQVLMLQCKHHLHKQCGKEWLVHNQTCPICLQKFDDASDKHYHDDQPNEQNDIQDIVADNKNKPNKAIADCNTESDDTEIQSLTHQGNPVTTTNRNKRKSFFSKLIVR